MAHWLTYLTEPGDLVAEPFCGGGTVPSICKRYKRRCVATDIDERAVMSSRQRLAETVAGQTFDQSEEEAHFAEMKRYSDESQAEAPNVLPFDR
jgi:DNA modification methylase